VTEPTSFEDQVEAIVRRDRRYDRMAYAFVSEALRHTAQRLGRKGQVVDPARGERTGHVSGRELCEGMAEFALQQYGRLARTVLEHWGVRRSEDIGEIVFNMVEVGLLNKTEEDRREDFVGVLDFAEALDRGFELHVESGGDA
jgi:uncharacterized repeat protein (TIGR04138 family)